METGLMPGFQMAARLFSFLFPKDKDDSEQVGKVQIERSLGEVTNPED